MVIKIDQLNDAFQYYFNFYDQQFIYNKCNKHLVFIVMIRDLLRLVNF